VASAPPGGDAVATAPLAPSFDEVDEWDAAHQLQLVDANAGSATRMESVEAPPPSVNAFPALPPPPTSTSSLSTDVTSYRLGAVWTGLNAPVPRAPSAPPLDAAGLLPSAPPPVEDDDQVASAPSAPPAWDDEELERDGTANTEQRVENAQNQSTNHETSHESRAQMASANDESDGDGTDSAPHTPPNIDVPRWSDTFRTRAQERVGLPRYEP
ncbi:hypothetical protein M408DRAFT_334065, partial [Serendipita vermifera MAFF 305830]